MAKKTKEKEDPNYRRICDNRKTCTAEHKTSTHEDMVITFCNQCFHVLDWNKIEPEKPKKEKKEKPEPVVEKVDSPVDKATENEADEMQQAFAEVDQVIADVDKMASKPKSEPQDVEIEEMEEFNPFDDEVDEEPKVGEFNIVKVQHEADNVIRLICEGEKGKARWLIDVETDPKKVQMIKKQPELVTSKMVKIEYDRLDELGKPINPKFLTLVKK